MDSMIIVSEPISKERLIELCEMRFGDMVKGVVDVEQCLMALGGELHADEEALLLENGSLQKDVWGINIYHALSRNEWIEFDSMINVRPGQGNKSRSIEDAELQARIIAIVNKLISE